MKNKVAIITSGYFPVPPVKGGAIETLVNILYEENIVKEKIKLSVYSVYDRIAEAAARSSENSNIVYIVIPGYIKIIDCISYFLFKNILKKKKHMSYRYIFQRLYYINAVSKDIAKKDFDSIVIENHPTLFGILRKRKNSERYKGKLYYHAHNEILKTYGYEKELNESHGFICVSRYISNRIHEVLPEYPLDKIKVLRNRIDENKFRNIDSEKIERFRNKYNIPKGYILFTFTGRLNPEKGAKELLMAFIKAHPKNSKLIIAGSHYFGSGIKSEYEDELKRLSEEMKENIIYTGHIDYDDMPCMYAVSDVIVLPSVWNDPAPLTVIESLTCGKPLITTCSGGIPEYASEKNSIILKIDDNLVDNIAKAILMLSKDAFRRNMLIDAAERDCLSWKKEDYFNEFVSMIK